MFSILATALMVSVSPFTALATATSLTGHSPAQTVKQSFQPAEFYRVPDQKNGLIWSNSKKINRAEWQLPPHWWAVLKSRWPEPELRRLRVDSTSYCQAGTTASGQLTHSGVVAMNILPMRTRVRVLSGPDAGTTLTVLDHIGYGSQFDIWQTSCAQAIDYGRHQITIEVLDA